MDDSFYLVVKTLNKDTQIIDLGGYIEELSIEGDVFEPELGYVLDIMERHKKQEFPLNNSMVYYEFQGVPYTKENAFTWAPKNGNDLFSPAILWIYGEYFDGAVIITSDYTGQYVDGEWVDLTALNGKHQNSIYYLPQDISEFYDPYFYYAVRDNTFSTFFDENIISALTSDKITIRFEFALDELETKYREICSNIMIFSLHVFTAYFEINEQELYTKVKDNRLYFQFSDGTDIAAEAMMEIMNNIKQK